MAALYKLRCNVIGHTKDVRSLAATIYPDNGIVSGSRDISARIWIPTEDSSGFVETQCLRGHSNFVSAVCVSPPDDTHPHGLIFTGSNDSTILAFSILSPEPLYKLSGHTSNVCALATGKFGTLVSGSWDKTARVWLKDKCVMTLEGHESAVWAVAVIPEKGFMITGSADKTIKLWAAGKLKDTLKGHTDCVRGLAILSNSEFLSCANDATIRRWLTTGQCIHTYYGHTNYIYALAVLPNGEDFVSCGEDRMLRVWRGGDCVQTVTHPAESVWAVCCLQNGDVATGASDGIIRVFTCDPSRMASQEEQTALEELVSALAIPTQIGDINVNELPGPDALSNPGQRDGQSKMVREGNVVILYHWDASGERWVKMGEIVGASGGSQATSGKKLCEGEEYDYVFDVDIEEGKPPLKLPYNIVEDPWVAAQKFIDKNNLSQLFLDQVAKFIQKNAEGVTLGQDPSAHIDPFTGGGRYVPGSGPDRNTIQNGYSGDPFTGASSYKTSDSAAPQTDNKYFPQREYLTFTSANQQNIINKLMEFNGKVDEHMGEQVKALMDGSGVKQQHFDLLAKLLQWSPDKIFPVLDVLRLAVCHESLNGYLCRDTEGRLFIEQLVCFVTADTHQSNRLLSLRVLANLFNQTGGADLVTAHHGVILPAIATAASVPNRNIQVAAATVLLNLVVVATRKPDEQLKLCCVNVAENCLAIDGADNEAAFRSLVALGTLVFADQMVVAAAISLGVERHVDRLSKVAEPVKVSECAKFIARLF